MRNQHPRHRIDVDRYYAMVTEGLLAPDARVELIDGEIVDMPPIGCPHDVVVGRLTRLLTFAAGEHALLRVQGAVRLDGYSEPQPDLALIAPIEEQYWQHYPGPAETFLIVEVSDSSWRYDRNVKLPLYARHGIPEFWMVDIAGGCIHCFRRPREGRYAESSTTADPGVVSLAALPEVQVDLTGLLDRPQPAAAVGR